MPSPEVDDLRDRAVLWPATGQYDLYGQPLLGPPVEVPVRWLGTLTEALDPQGNTIALDAWASVGQDVPVGSMMWNGTLAEWYGVGSAGPDTGLCIAKVFDGTPDVKNRAWRRTVGLMRLRQDVHSA